MNFTNKEYSTFTKKARSNFESTVRLWGGLPSSDMEEKNGILVVSTGVAIPDQNYAIGILPEAPAASPAAARSFFRKKGMPFTWWVPPGDDNIKESERIAGDGLPRRCAPPAMFYSLADLPERRDPPSGITVKHVTESGEASLWALCSLEGFGSGAEHGEAFTRFTSSMLNAPEKSFFRLTAVFSGNTAAGTAMLSIAGDTAGLYYFSVVRSFRGKGLGKVLLESVLDEAKGAGCSAVTLQASPMGFPMYRKFGFRECGRFLVHSPDPDAC